MCHYTSCVHLSISQLTDITGTAKEAFRPLLTNCVPSPRLAQTRGYNRKIVGSSASAWVMYRSHKISLISFLFATCLRSDPSKLSLQISFKALVSVDFLKPPWARSRSMFIPTPSKQTSSTYNTQENSQFPKLWALVSAIVSKSALKTIL